MSRSRTFTSEELLQRREERYTRGEGGRNLPLGTVRPLPDSVKRLAMRGTSMACTVDCMKGDWGWR